MHTSNISSHIGCSNIQWYAVPPLLIGIFLSHIRIQWSKLKEKRTVTYLIKFTKVKQICLENDIHISVLKIRQQLKKY